MSRPPPRSQPFPYTTLFRSDGRVHTRCASENLCGPCSEGPVIDLSPTAYVTGLTIPSQYNLWLAERSEETPKYLSASHRRSEEHTSELQSRVDLVCRLLLEK